MEIALRFSSINERELKSDIAVFEKLDLDLPIKYEFIFESPPKVTIDSIARAHYYRREWNGKMERGRIEFSDRYFQNNKEIRILTILHEIIHIHFLSTDLYSWMKIKKKLLDIIRKEIGTPYPPEKESVVKPIINELGRKMGLIAFTLNILDEIWAEIYMKRNYPEYFERRKVFFYNMRKENVEKRTPEMDRFQKFAWFWQLLHISFFMRLIEGDKENLKLFKELYAEIEEKLNSLIDGEERKFFKDYEERLCNFNDYPDSSQLEQDYLEFAEYILKI